MKFKSPTTPGVGGGGGGGNLNKLVFIFLDKQFKNISSQNFVIPQKQTNFVLNKNIHFF